MTDDRHTLNCTHVRTTPDAVLVSTGVGEVWLPMAELTIVAGMFGAMEIEMPRWLAEEKHLVAVADPAQGRLF